MIEFSPNALYENFKSIAPELNEGTWNKIWSAISDKNKKALQRDFSIKNRSVGNRFILRCILWILSLVPFSLRRFAIENAKSVRTGKQTESDPYEELSFSSSSASSLIQHIGTNRIHFPGSGCVSLTYDIDQPACMDYLPRALNVFSERGINAVFNFLTGGEYTLPVDLTDRITTEGHELGLHGHRHDIDFGNRSFRYIDKTLQQCRTLLPYQKGGFRSPALSISPHMIFALEKNDFLYDSTVPAANPFYRSCGFPYPYRFPGLRLFEFPVLLQDNTLFSDFKLDDKNGLELACKIIRNCLRQKGLAVINLHLYIERNHEQFHFGLLDWLIKEEIPVVTLADCCNNFTRNNKKSEKALS